MTEKIATKLNGKQPAALKAYEEATAALAKLSGLTHALKCLALSAACEEREQAILAISAFAQGECRSAGEQVQLLYKWAREKAENGKESPTTAAAELLGTRDEPALARGQEV
jgi:hypothetical protein